MYYGLKFKEKEVQPVLSISEQTFGVDSLVYNEYMNRKTLMECLLEEAVDNTERIRLEAQLEVLREVSFNDIWEKIKKTVRKIIEFLKGIAKKIKEFFIKNKKKKDKEAEKIINDIDIDNFGDHVEEMTKPYFDMVNSTFDEIHNDYQKRIDELKAMNERLDNLLNKVKEQNIKKESYNILSLEPMVFDITNESFVLNEKNDIANTGSKSADMSIINALFRTAFKHPELLIEPDELDFKILNDIVKSINMDKNTEYEDIVDFYDAIVRFEQEKRDYLKQIEKAKVKAEKIFKDHLVEELSKTIQSTSDKLDARIDQYNNVTLALTKKLEFITTKTVSGLDSVEVFQYYSAMVGVIGKLKDFIAYQVMKYSKASSAATVLWDYICAIKDEHRL